MSILDSNTFKKRLKGLCQFILCSFLNDKSLRFLKGICLLAVRIRQVPDKRDSMPAKLAKGHKGRALQLIRPSPIALSRSFLVSMH